MYGYGFVNTFNIHGTGAPAFDADAQAFITAASITDPTQQSAVNQLVLDWKADGIWNDIDEAYPYVGSNSTAHRYDIKSATAKGTFFGGVTHNGNGVTFNGTTGFMSSSWSCTALNLYDRHYSQYIRTLTTAVAWTGKFDGDNVFGMKLNTATSLEQVGCNNLPASFSQAVSANAVTCVNIESNTIGKVYNNGSLVHTTPSAINASPTSGVMYVGALTDASSFPAFYQDSNLAFVTYGKSLNATKQAALNTSIKNFNTALGR